MGVEVVDAKVAVIKPENEAGLSLDNGVNIRFGSHSTDEKLNGEVNGAPESNMQKNAADEWPQLQQIHSFFIVRYRPFEDQNLKAKMELAEKELQKKKQARLQIIEKIKSKRADRVQVITEIRNLSVENKQYRTMMDEKKKEMEPLQQALGKLRGASGGRDKGSTLCSSEEELNELIKSFQYRIQHESITLNEEKQILREIRQLEGTRERVIANATERAMIEGSMGEKGVIQDQVKSIGVDLDGVRKEKQLINAKLKRHDDEKLAIEKEIMLLEDELSAVTESRDNIFERIKELRKQRDDGNSPFYQNRALLMKAKSLAAEKNIDALVELCNREEENFMLLWNSNKSFRDDYVRRILPSFDQRQLNGDGRLRNSDEKPLAQVKTSPPETEVLKVGAKQIQNDSYAVLVDPPSEHKASKHKDSKNQKEGTKKSEKTKGKTEILEDEEEFSIETSPQDPLPKVEVDPTKLKELKREEEMAKRIQAEERKKKLAEKAAAKATLKAQKDAEKKLKEREKRARKKAGASAVSADDSEEPTEPVPEDAELTKKEEPTPEIPMPQKNKESKEAPIRRRTRPPRSRVDSLPKAVVKRKKSVNYWVWAVPAALAVVLLLTVVYLYTR